MAQYKILVLNFGSTSSKMAVYEDEVKTREKNVSHDREVLTGFGKMIDQYPLRLQTVRDYLEEIGMKPSDFDAISARAGTTKPLAENGAYAINAKMVEDLRERPLLDHPSNMCPMVAYELAQEGGVPCMIYDSLFDQMEPVAKLTGIPDIKRTHMGHVENMSFAAHKAAAELGIPYEKVNLIVTHLGGGITQACVKNGRFADFNDSSNSPFSPERAGIIPARQFAKLIYSGKYTESEITKMITGRGGMYAHLGTSDCREVEQRIGSGDEKAELVYDAMAYQTAKGIGAFAAALEGRVDAVVITGGIANSKNFVDRIVRRVEFLGKVLVYPGEFEMENLGLGALRVLRGEEPVREYVSPQ